MYSLIKNFLTVAAGAAFLATSASAAGIQLEPVGSFNIALTTAGVTDNQRITGTFMSGTITLGDGQGTVQACVEDGYIREKGNLEFDLRCHATMDDGAVLLISYRGTIVPDATFWDVLMSGGTVTKGAGFKYWVSQKKMSTTSEKYSWLNDYIIVGDGQKIRGPSESGPGEVAYVLYRIAQ